MISHEIYLFSLQLNQAYWACADGTADKGLFAFKGVADF